MKDASFSREQVMEAFSRTRKQPSLVAQASSGQRSWTSALLILSWRLVLVFVAALLLFFFLALIVFASSSVALSETSGAFVDPESGDQPVGTAATTTLRHLWDFPSLPLSELRTVEDVVFFHDRAVHTMRVSSVARHQAGEIEIWSPDRTLLRIQPDGRAFWQRYGQSEIFLEAMERLRFTPGATEMGQNSFATFTKQITRPTTT